MKYVIFTILCITKNIECLSCSEILEQPPNKTWSLSELQSVLPKDIIECLAHLGKEQLHPESANFIWKSIITFYDGIESIPDKVLMILHWVTPALTPDDYANLTLSNIDVIENFGLNYNLNQEQLATIADKVREDFAGKEPEDYTYYDLIALRQILCQFNKSEIERIHPSAYREAALIIGKLENCVSEAMTGFALLSMKPTAFGTPDRWTEATLKTLGKVAEYLPYEVINRFATEQNMAHKRKY